ncbi:MAG: tetratricopeptide repeat protein [Bacteroidales bacterium]
MNRMIITLIVALFAILPATADSGESALLFRKANQLYLDGDLPGAREEYMKIVNAGLESAELYYNLGNTCYKMGLIPSAILYFEKSLVLNPGDEDTRFNLSLANQLIVDKIEPLNRFFVSRWVDNLAGLLRTDAWARISLVTFILTLISIVIIYGTRRIVLKKTLLLCAILMSLMSVTSFLLGHKSYHALNITPSAIVFSPSITAKSSPDSSGTDLFVLHEGTKVRITDQVGAWLRIRLADGNQAWIPADSVEKI